MLLVEKVALQQTPEDFSLPAPNPSLQLPGFPLFSFLPTELRLKIWSFALPGPRIIQIKRTYNPSINAHKSRSTFQWQSTQKHPTILAVNRESREEALKNYTMIQTSESDGGFRLAFDPELDTVYDPYSVRGVSARTFEGKQFQTYGGRGDVRVRFVAINEQYLLRDRYSANWKGVGCWFAFEEVVIVVCLENVWDWPLPEGCEGTRELIWGVESEREFGGVDWGDYCVQNEFMRLLDEEWRMRAGRGQIGRPRVRAVHSHFLKGDEEGFCIGLTTGSLSRKRRVPSKRVVRRLL